MRPILLSLLAILVLVPLSAISETTPGSAQDFFERGKYFLENGQFEKAVHEFSSALDLDEDHPKARYYRGMAYVMLESYALAIVDFSDYVAKNKDDEKGWYWRARARFGFGEAEQALNDLDRALELNELYAPALVLKGDIQAARNQYQAAIKMYTKALEIYIFDLDVVLKRIECFMKVHDYERAVKDCSEILAKFPDYYQAYYLRSSAYKALLQLDKAEADINKGLTLDPDKQNSLAMFSRAMCRMLQGKFDGAVADLRTAAFVDSPDRAAYSLHFCIALGASGRPQDVRAEYELAKKNLPAIVGEEEFNKRWKILFSYTADVADRQDLVQEVINNIDDLEFCGRAYYAIGVRKLANGKLLECLDAFSKVLEYGSEGQVEYMQSQLYLKLLDSDRLKCPPSPADAAAQPEDNGTGAGEKKQQ